MMGRFFLSVKALDKSGEVLYYSINLLETFQVSLIAKLIRFKFGSS